MGSKQSTDIQSHQLSKEPLHHFENFERSIKMGGEETDRSAFNFNDFEVLKAAKMMHIDQIDFLYENILMGMIIYYNIEGQRVIRKNYDPTHLNQAIHQQIQFGETEHIIELIVTWGQEGLHSLTGTTNLGQIFTIEGLSGFGTQSKILKPLKNDGRVIVGFSGKVNQYLLQLEVITMQPISKKFPMVFEITPDSSQQQSENDSVVNEESDSENSSEEKSNM